LQRQGKLDEAIFTGGTAIVNGFHVPGGRFPLSLPTASGLHQPAIAKAANGWLMQVSLTRQEWRETFPASAIISGMPTMRAFAENLP
jgi:hypothetical protein